jgi:hypothetical protein
MNIQDSDLMDVLLRMTRELAPALADRLVTCIVLEVDVGQGGLEVSIASPEELSADTFDAILAGQLDPEVQMQIGGWELSSCKWELCPEFASSWSSKWEGRISDCCALMIELGFDHERSAVKNWILNALALAAAELERVAELKDSPRIIAIEVAEPILEALARYRSAGEAIVGPNRGRP